MTCGALLREGTANIVKARNTHVKARSPTEHVTQMRLMVLPMNRPNIL